MSFERQFHSIPIEFARLSLLIKYFDRNWREIVRLWCSSFRYLPICTFCLTAIFGTACYKFNYNMIMYGFLFFCKSLNDLKREIQCIRMDKLPPSTPKSDKDVPWIVCLHMFLSAIFIDLWNKNKTFKYVRHANLSRNDSMQNAFLLWLRIQWIIIGIHWILLYLVSFSFHYYMHSTVQFNILQRL